MVREKLPDTKEQIRKFIIEKVDDLFISFLLLVLAIILSDDLEIRNRNRNFEFVLRISLNLSNNLPMEKMFKNNTNCFDSTQIVICFDLFSKRP